MIYDLSGAYASITGALASVKSNFPHSINVKTPSGATEKLKVSYSSDNGITYCQCGKFSSCVRLADSDFTLILSDAAKDFFIDNSELIKMIFSSPLIKDIKGIEIHLELTDKER